MKNLKSFLLFFLFPLFGITQSINGIYTGVLSNDSTTIRKDQSFEMALTEYRGKVFGYAYSTFIINDTLYYIVKRVKGKIDGDICEVEDDEVISHNFPQRPEKKVFVTYTLRRNASDSIWRLDGNWKTNLVKKRFYAISGKVETKEEKDLSKSKLYEHLGDLDLQKTLVFNKPKETLPEKKPVKAKEEKNAIAKNDLKKEEKKIADTKTVDKKSNAAVAKTEGKLPDNKPVSNPIINSPIQNEKKDVPVSTTTAFDKKPENNIAKPEAKVPDNKAVSITANNPAVQNVIKDSLTANTSVIEKKPETNITKVEKKQPENKTNSIVVNNQPNQNEKITVIPTNTNPNDKKPETPIAKSEVKAPERKLVSVPVGNQPNQNEKKDVSITDNKTANKKPDAGFEFQELKRTDRKLKPAASLVDGRVSVPSETIYFHSDSLSIALYDNGEVDGDTVSVIINDVMFIEKQGLKSSAFRKTFYIPQQESDSLLVVLYADNLGKYPPNTGLLQIKDGEEIFYVRFRADLDRNAALVLRRKSK